MRRAAREAQKALLPPIPDHALTRRAANPFGLSVTLDVRTDTLEEKKNPALKSRGISLDPTAPEKGPFGFTASQHSTGFRFSLDFKKLLAAIPRPKKHPKGDAVFAKAEKPPDRKSRAIQLATEDEKKVKAQAEHLKLQLADKEDETREVRQRLVTIETESRAVHRRLTTTIEEVKIWKVKSEATEERLSQSLAKLAVEEQKLLDVQKLADKKDVEITTATRKLITAIEEVKVWKIKSEATEEKFKEALDKLSEATTKLAAEEKKREATERELADVRAEMEKSAQAMRRKVSIMEEDVKSWRVKTESVEERLARSLAAFAEEERLRKKLEKELASERREKENLKDDLKKSFAALKTSEEAAQALRESESMLTAAVESNAVTIKDIRAQLDAMRIDRDKEKTNAKESRVQNGVLRCASPPPPA